MAHGRIIITQSLLSENARLCRRESLHRQDDEDEQKLVMINCTANPLTSHLSMKQHLVFSDGERKTAQI